MIPPLSLWLGSLAPDHLQEVSSPIHLTGRPTGRYSTHRIVLSLLTAGITFLRAAPHPVDAALLAPLESFFVESSRFAERLSPDGMNVAYLGPDERAINRLWMVNLNDLGSPRIISTEVTTAVVSFFWIGDGELLWQSTFSDGRVCLFLSNTKNGKTREILPNEKRIIHLEGVVDSEEPCILVGLSDASNAFPDLYRVSLRENDAPVVAQANHHQIITWAWDERGTLVAGLRWTNTGAKKLLSLRESPARVIFRAEPADDLRLLMASADGKRALVLSDHGNNFTHAEWIGLTTGSREKFGADPMGRVDLEGLLTAGDSILAASYSDNNRRWIAIDSEFSPTLKALRLAAGSDNLTIIGIDESRSRFLFKRLSARDPGTVCLYDTKTKTSHILWRVRTGLDLSSLCDTCPIEYTARDGNRIPAYLTLPNKGKGSWPVIIFPHGGPRMRTYAGFDGRVQFLASRGYAVLQPNFRGSRGYGKAFMNAGDGQWGKGVMQTDVTDGVDYLIHKGLADPRRIAVLGGSYGGYAALAGLAFTPDRYVAGICLFGISDLMDYATVFSMESEVYAGDTVRRVGDPTTLAGPTLLEDLSTVNHADSFIAPLLIYHGAKDTLIPVSHARRMVHALEKSGKQVEYLQATDEGHGFAHPETEMAVYRAIEIFLHEHLGGGVGPDPADSVSRRLSKLRSAGQVGASER